MTELEGEMVAPVPASAPHNKSSQLETSDIKFLTKLQILMFISSHFKFQGVLLEENFTRKPMELLLEPQSFV